MVQLRLCVKLTGFLRGTKMTQEAILITTTPPLPGLTLVNAINDANLTIATNFAGTNDPAAQADAYMTWADTATGFLKRRNAANSAWTIVGRIYSALYEDASGNLGLGNTNPTEKLDVTGNIKSNSVITDGVKLLTTSSGSITLLSENTTSNLTVTIPASTGTLVTDDTLATDIAAELNATGSAPLYACRAWVNFDGTGTVAIRASGNVSSITDGGVGTYTVNFTTAMQDANYAFFAQSIPTNSVSEHADASANLTTSLLIFTRNDSNVFYDADVVRVAVFR
jgi:hypothetical protein